MNRRQKVGRTGETMAVRFLKKKGYKIVAQNYTTPLGEIDIIATDRKRIAFVEVKTRRSNRYGNPKYAITPKKMRKIPYGRIIIVTLHCRYNNLYISIKKRVITGYIYVVMRHHL